MAKTPSDKLYRLIRSLSPAEKRYFRIYIRGKTDRNSKYLHLFSLMAAQETFDEEYLKNKNYTILFMNWRYKHSEIDIIAHDGKMVVFVEVKSRKNNQFGNPEEFVTKQKIKKMHEAAEAYIVQFDWKGELRFDIIAIESNKDIMHFEDAFY